MGGMCENDDEEECELCDVYVFDKRTGKVTQKMEYVAEGAEVNEAYNFASGIRMFAYTS